MKKWLQKNNACNPSIIWIKQNNIQSLKEAWYACERGDWLLWMAEKLGVDKHKLVLCGALCAHTVVQYMEDARSRNAVRIAFLWGRGKATDKQLSSAGDAALNAALAGDADANAAALAAVAAALANDADADAFALAAIASTAASAAAVAASTTSASNGVDARQANQLRTAEIVRKILTNDVMKKIKEIK